MSNNLFQFINKYKVTDNSPHTHVSMGFPYGKFNIPQDKTDEFHNIYSQYVGKINLHIAEKQLDMSQLIIDIDILQTTQTRKYTSDDIKEIVSITNNILTHTHNIDNQLLKAFIMEKQSPLKSGINYKDGIHIMYPYVMLNKNNRKLIIEKITEESKVKHLFENYNFINNLDNTFDKAIINVPWLMYGSRKKNGSTYSLTQIISYNLSSIDINTLHVKEIIDILSINKNNNPTNNIVHKNNSFTPVNKINNYNTYIAKKLLDMLPISYSTHYHQWITICWVLYPFHHKV